ncbi:hypothetical protein C8J57DRAFT_1557666 [Mycena rebaudengoi]|nr:hypothetical protein C8J57DRAFT_1557666 [Mycena rebaudengoi]
MSVRMWLNIGVRSVDVLEHWGIDLHVKPRRHGGTTVPEHEYLHPHMRRCRREQGGRCGRGLGIGTVGCGVAVADAASGVPGDSAGSASPRRRCRRRGSTPIHPHAPACHTPFLVVFPHGSGCTGTGASWSERKVGWCAKWGSYRKQRWRGCTRVQAQDDKEPSTPSFRVNDGRGGRKVSETTQIRGTVEKEDKTQMRLSSGSRAAECTLAQSDPSRNTALNPALNPISIRGKCKNLNKDGLGPGQTPPPPVLAPGEPPTSNKTLRGFRTEPEARVACWGIGLYLGVVRPQNRASDVLGDVRDTGKSYTAPGGRGYNTNAGLDFHQDSCDVVALLCRRTAKSGGTSRSLQNTQDPETQPPFYRCPIFGHIDTDTRRFFCARTNRKNIVAAQRDFPEVPCLKAEQHRALDVLDKIMADDEFCYSMELERGDMQLLNSFVTLHSRTPFEDHAEPDKKRHLLRLWLAIPAGQPLPREWAEYWGDVQAGAVRGGLRGEGITDDCLSYERRQAEAMGIRFEPWKPVVRKDDMARILERGNA